MCCLAGVGVCSLKQSFPPPKRAGIRLLGHKSRVPFCPASVAPLRPGSFPQCMKHKILWGYLEVQVWGPARQQCPLKPQVRGAQELEPDRSHLPYTPSLVSHQLSTYQGGTPLSIPAYPTPLSQMFDDLTCGEKTRVPLASDTILCSPVKTPEAKN